jgi:hypothetical protein
VEDERERERERRRREKRKREKREVREKEVPAARQKRERPSLYVLGAPSSSADIRWQFPTEIEFCNW